LYKVPKIIHFTESEIKISGAFKAVYFFDIYQLKKLQTID